MNLSGVSSETTPRVKIRVNASKSFSSQGKVLQVLGKVDIQIYEGEFVCIVGRSGCGKSTLLRIIADLVKPSSGEVRVDGKPPDLKSSSIGFIFQQDALLPWRTVADNIKLGLEIKNVPEPEARRRIENLINLIGLKGFENYYPNQLSGGMRQRVSIARAFAINPDILLMDEPFAALDAQTRSIMHDEILRIWEVLKGTVVFVTHSVEEAVVLSDRVLVLSERPGHVKSAFKIDLDRPRARMDRGFIELRHKIEQEILAGSCGEEPAIETSGLPALP